VAQRSGVEPVPAFNYLLQAGTYTLRHETLWRMQQTKPSPQSALPLVGVIMGSKSDWETMRHTHEALSQLGIPHECRIVSAHRTPGLLQEYAGGAEARGIEIIIAGAGGAAHLPGMAAAFAPTLPVLGVPVESQALKGQDSLLSIVQMPGGVPVGTLAIGKAGAINAALLAVAILGNSRPEVRERLRAFRAAQTERVLSDELPTGDTV
jgi:5-(carboxyamino)imidazole ribonucleotide mutase